MEDLQVDRINALPDAIIHHIFSFLNIVDVVQTSILSSRWRYMWQFTPVLSFNFDEWLKDYDVLWSTTRKPRRDVLMEFVSKILVLGEDSNISKFCVYSSRGGFKEYRLLEWIKSALSRRAEHVCFQIPVNKPLNFPHNLFTENIRVLELLISRDVTYYDTQVRLPSSLCTAPLLKILKLANVILPEGDVDGELVLNCPLLETLGILKCQVKHLNSLTILTPRLVSLEVEMSDKYGPCMVKICTPNLRSLKLTTTFTYSGYNVGDYCLEDLSSLSSAEICVDVQDEEDLGIWLDESPHLMISCTEFLSKILPRVNSAQTLKLKVPVHAVQVLAETPQFMERVPHLLHKVKYLMLMDWWVPVPTIVSFLQRLPCIERLVWRKKIYEQNMADSEEEEWVAAISSWQNNFKSLERIEIGFFEGNEIEMKLLDFLLRRAKFFSRQPNSFQIKTQLKSRTSYCQLLVSLQLL